MHMHTARWMLPTSWVWKSALKHCFTNTKPLTEMKHGYLATHLSLGHPCCSLPWPHGGGGNRKLPGKIGMAWHAPIRQCLINCLSLLRYINIQCLFMCILRWAPGPEILPPNHLHCIFQKCMEQKKLPASKGSISRKEHMTIAIPALRLLGFLMQQRSKDTRSFATKHLWQEPTLLTLADSCCETSNHSTNLFNKDSKSSVSNRTYVFLVLLGPNPHEAGLQSEHHVPQRGKNFQSIPKLWGQYLMIFIYIYIYIYIFMPNMPS